MMKYVSSRTAGFLAKTGATTLQNMADPSVKTKICVVPGWATNARSLDYVMATDTSLINNYEAVTATDPDSGPDTAARMILDGTCDVAYMYDDTVDSRQGCTFQGCSASLWSSIKLNATWLKTGITSYAAGGTTGAFSRYDSNLPDILSTALPAVLRSDFYRQLCCDYNEHGVYLGATEPLKTFDISKCIGYTKPGDSATGTVTHLGVSYGRFNCENYPSSNRIGLAFDSAAGKLSGTLVSAMTPSPLPVPKYDGRTVLIASGANFPPWDTAVNKPGQPEFVTGFGLTLLKEICQKAGLKCRVVRDDHSNCWSADDMPGAGLMNRDFDACTSFTHTYSRANSLKFTKNDYVQSVTGGFLGRLAVTGNQTSPAWGADKMSDCALTTKICWAAGWSTSARAIEYIESLGICKYEAVRVEDPFGGVDSVMRALLADKCHLAWLPDDTINSRSNCENIGCDPTLYDGEGKDYEWVRSGIKFAHGGITPVMARIDSEIPEMMDAVMPDVLASPFYRQVRCQMLQFGPT